MSRAVVDLGGALDVGGLDAPDRGEPVAHDRHARGLVARAAVRLGRQIGAVGLEDERRRREHPREPPGSLEFLYVSGPPMPMRKPSSIARRASSTPPGKAWKIPPTSEAPSSRRIAIVSANASREWTTIGFLK